LGVCPACWPSLFLCRPLGTTAGWSSGRARKSVPPRPCPPQAEVIEEIRRAVEDKLLASNESRTFATLQTQLPFAALPLVQRQPPPDPDRGRAEAGRNAQALLQPVAPRDGIEDEEEAGDEEEEDDDDEDKDDDDEEEAGAGRGGKATGRRRRSALAPLRALGSGGGGGGGAQDLKRAASGAPAPLPYRPEKLVRVDYRWACTGVPDPRRDGRTRQPAAPLPYSGLGRHSGLGHLPRIV
jgi:hypothetical protein